MFEENIRFEMLASRLKSRLVCPAICLQFISPEIVHTTPNTTVPKMQPTGEDCVSPVDFLPEHDRCSSPSNLFSIRPAHSVGMVAFAPVREVLIIRPKTNAIPFDWRSKLISSDFSGLERGPALLDTACLKRKLSPMRTAGSGLRFKASKRKAAGRTPKTTRKFKGADDISSSCFSDQLTQTNSKCLVFP